MSEKVTADIEITNKTHKDFFLPIICIKRPDAYPPITSATPKTVMQNRAILIGQEVLPSLSSETLCAISLTK